MIGSEGERKDFVAHPRKDEQARNERSEVTHVNCNLIL